MAINFL